MSDRALRSSARLARRGDPGASDRLLLEQVRAGLVPAARLEVRAVLERAAAAARPDPAALVTALAALEPRAAAAACLAAAVPPLLRWEAWQAATFAPWDRPRRAWWRAVAGWHGPGDPERRREARATAQLAAQAVESTGQLLATLEAEHRLSPDVWLPVRAGWACLDALSAAAGLLWPGCDSGPVAEPAAALRGAAAWSGGPEGLARGLAAALLPWARGGRCRWGAARPVGSP